ncbi:MAG: ATP-dependent helicase [Chloroflexi bacterium]|nr:ATP-dependent helicase [Chloroflexota bacterium]
MLCVAPAGSGKTSTLVARITWLVDRGFPAEQVCALTFNRRAAEELRERRDAALEPLGEGLADRVRVRTFHALGLEILREAGRPVEPLLERETILRAVRPDADGAERRRLDTLISRFKLDLAVDPAEIEADPDAGLVARTYAEYEREIERRGGLDFDDLVARALRLLESEPDVLQAWRGRCGHLLVDEAQDLDRSQLRMALLLMAPANRVFFVGDDDQSIYGWRLADVRRLLNLAAEALPGLLRVDLETNYRCPAVVLARAVRLVEHNRERFAKVIRPGPKAAGRLLLAPSAADEIQLAAAILTSWPADDGSRAVLARTNRELLPVAAAALRLGVPFRAADLVLPVESPIVDELLAEIANTDSGLPLLVRVGRVRRGIARAAAALAGAAPPVDDSDGPDRAAVATALLGWAAGCLDLADLRAGVAWTRQRLAELRRDEAPLVLATAHGTKGLEFDHVAVIGLDAVRFPSARSVAEAAEPELALEEERRLAYVAWTRARRSLTLAYDPGLPSPFLLEAFTAEELGLPPAVPLRSA